MTTDPRTFDLFDIEESVEYPTDSVIVHRNRKALYELSGVLDTINRTIDPDVVEKLEAEAAGIRAAIKKTDLRITLKGLPTTTIEDIQKSIPEPTYTPPADNASASEKALYESEYAKLIDDRNAVFNMKVLQTMIVDIVEVESGRVANHPQDRTREWFETLPMEERARVVTKIRELSFSVLEAEAEVDSPGF